MNLELAQYGLGTIGGVLMGLTLGLFGGGGSILAVPLMVYLVGVPNAHLALGTSALAVAVNAAVNLLAHARLGHVRWRCALIYSAAGIAGAFVGSSLGKVIPGERLLFMFAFLMIAVGVLTVRGRRNIGNPSASCTIHNSPRTLAFGLCTGVLSGFFGIGGGFLVVPGLMAATNMPMLMAVGSSLVAVTAFGLTTSLNYASSGLVDWPLAAVFIGGGTLGGAAGALASDYVARFKGLLNMMFAGLIFVVAAYMLWRSALVLLL